MSKCSLKWASILFVRFISSETDTTHTLSLFFTLSNPFRMLALGVDNRGRTPLHIACGMGNKGAVKSLIAKVENDGLLFFLTPCLILYIVLLTTISNSLFFSLQVPINCTISSGMKMRAVAFGRIIYAFSLVLSFLSLIFVCFLLFFKVTSKSKKSVLTFSPSLSLFFLNVTGLTAPHHKESLLLCCGADGVDGEIGPNVLELFRGILKRLNILWPF